MSDVLKTSDGTISQSGITSLQHLIPKFKALGSDAGAVRSCQKS